MFLNEFPPLLPGSASAAASTNGHSNGDSNGAAKPVNDISHMLKKKRKSEPEGSNGAENGAGDAKRQKTGENGYDISHK